MRTTRKLTIFEGPDGGGKSTLAKAYAEVASARYVHFPALPRVNKGLARMYVEAMLPALLGYQDVVFDRSWYSEDPYGTVFREGQDRLGAETVRMLERLALRCGAVVVYCMPDVEVVKQNYRSRKHLEMLDNEDQLQAVYDIYCEQKPSLPVLDSDYTIAHLNDLIDRVKSVKRPSNHPLGILSAGNLDAAVVLVGQDFAERKDQDAFYQWPFASFDRSGCSHWLTQQLISAGVSEHDLMWVNSDQNLSIIGPHQTVIAMGDKAHNECAKAGIAHISVPHPQYAKRFNRGYNLGKILIDQLLKKGQLR